MKTPGPTFPNANSTPTRVLVAEDNDKTRIALVFLLQRHGYDVTVVSDGQAALDILLAPDPPHVALLDWEMPRLDGLHVCMGVRTLPTRPYTYIVMLTAHDRASDMLAAFAAGVDDFLSKPVDSPQLLARLRCGERVLALEQRAVERIAELEKALEKVRQLKRLLPICSYCKKVRDDSDYWQEIDAYIHEQTGTDFSHGGCPTCMETVRAEECSPEAKARRARQNK
jgi:CheY-like chemotaxis protein